MLKKTVSYEDFDGNKREEEVFFHLSESEMVRLEVEFPGGLAAHLDRLDAAGNPDEILRFFERLIGASYGEKSPDGRYFLKSEEKTALFRQSALYNAFFMELITDTDAAIAFAKGVIPKAIADKMEEAK